MVEFYEIVAHRLLERNANFVPTRRYPAPSLMPGRCDADDVAAVLMRRKPAAFFSIRNDRPNPLVEAILKKADQWHVLIAEIPHLVPYCRSIITGKPDSVLGIYDLFTIKSTAKLHTRYRQLGRFLGYPEDAINDFIERINNFKYKAS